MTYTYLRTQLDLQSMRLSRIIQLIEKGEMNSHTAMFLYPELADILEDYLMMTSEDSSITDLRKAL